jgi:acylphosphatase
MNWVARRYLVAGRVQGVGYRFFVLRVAARHSIYGIVRNLPDGSVEILAEGERADIEEFRKELAAGPLLSEVTSIDEIDIQASGRFREFRIDH